MKEEAYKKWLEMKLKEKEVVNCEKMSEKRLKLRPIQKTLRDEPGIRMGKTIDPADTEGQFHHHWRKVKIPFCFTDKK